jgi:hypothetical protein
MTDSCGCPPEAGNIVCELPARDTERVSRAQNACPECRKIGKPVQAQTVKAMLSVTLGRMENTQYLFCKTQTCPVVYFSVDGKQPFVVEELRERVYQKEPEAKDVFICYCFRHTAGDLRAASPEGRITILDDIDLGIGAGQCACDLRNPQGSCCLGNIRIMTKRLEKPGVATS